MAKISIALALLGILGLASSGCQPPRSNPPGTSGPPPGCVPLSADERIAAMLSVHANSYAARGLLPAGQTPTSLGLMPLNDAVNKLLKDCDRLASSRRRRAAAKLAAYGRNGPEFASPWRSLVGDPALIAKVEEILQPPTETEQPTNVESKVFDVLAGLTEAFDCSLDKPEFTGPSLSPNGGEVAWEIAFTADGTAKQVAERIDPQNWSACVNQFFAETFYTTEAPARISSCKMGTITSPQANNPKTYGTAYEAVLFEHFSCRACTSELENLLTIQTVRNAKCAKRSPCEAAGLDPTPSFQVCYSLPAEPLVACGDPPKGKKMCRSNALYGCVGDPKTHVDLIEDQGDLSACSPQSGKGQRMVSRKTMKFNRPFDNLGAWLLFALGEQEQTEGWIDMVCCKP